MTHYHCEIVLPAGTADVGAAIAAVLKPFCEQGNADNEDSEPRYAFWDWYALGGRWSGEHVLAGLDKARLAAFHAELQKREVTVSSFRAGKETLKPASQQEMVDALWREWFPASGLEQCPLFDHSVVGRYDITTLAKVPMALTCERVIVCHANEPRADFMLVKSFYNGVYWQDAAWDGTLRHALELYAARGYGKRIDHPDAVVVTVDYHS